MCAKQWGAAVSVAKGCPDGLVSTEPRGELYDCRFNGSCFPLGDVVPIGSQSVAKVDQGEIGRQIITAKVFLTAVPQHSNNV